MPLGVETRLKTARGSQSEARIAAVWAPEFRYTNQCSLPKLALPKFLAYPWVPKNHLNLYYLFLSFNLGLGILLLCSILN